jgi:hypothetical protein
MQAQSSTPVSIEFRDLVFAFEFASAGLPREHRACICANTGKIYFFIRRDRRRGGAAG